MCRGLMVANQLKSEPLYHWSYLIGDKICNFDTRRSYKINQENDRGQNITIRFSLSDQFHYIRIVGQVHLAYFGVCQRQCDTLVQVMYALA